MSMITPPRRSRRLRPVGDDGTPLSDTIERMLPGDPEPADDQPAQEADAEPSTTREDTSPAGDDAPPGPRAGKAPREEAQRAAIIPGVPGERWQAVKDGAELVAYRTAFHGIRSVYLYPPGALYFAVRGAARLGLRWATWADVTDLRVLMSQAMTRGSAGHTDVMTAHKEREHTKERRRKLAGFTAASAALLSYTLYQAAPPEAQAAAVAAAFAALVYAGKPEGGRLLPAAILPPNYQPPSFELIREALVAIIPAIKTHVAAKGDLDWVSDVHRDGDGWAVELDLPRGVTAALIIKKRAELSSALRRPLSAVWPEGVPGEHEGRLFIWIGRHDWAKKKLVPYPLLKSGTADFFDLVPFGTMPRGNGITVPLFQTNWLFGGAMGSGKTSAIRTLLAAAALDTIVDLWTHEFSGKGDLYPFAQVSHRYVSGMDDEAIAYAAESVKMLKADLVRRQKIWKKIPREQRTEAHLTREIAQSDKRLRPIVAVFDECHNMFQHPIHGKQIQADLEWVMRIGRAYGIVVILGTQRPGADSIPVIITAVTVARCCLKVSDHTTNDMILGTGSFGKGHDATVFRLPLIDAGCCWLKGIGDTIAPKIYYLNDPATQKIGNRARAMREKAGVLAGYALGENDEQQAERSLLADVLAVFGPSERFLYWETVAARLADSYPGTYSGLTADAASADVRDLTDQPSDQGREPGGDNRKGLKRATVEAAAGGGREPVEDSPVSDDDMPAVTEPAFDAETIAAAAELVIIPQFASAEMLHRKLRISMKDTGRLLDELEARGIVGPDQRPEPREVLKGPDDLDEVVRKIREASSV